MLPIFHSTLEAWCHFGVFDLGSQQSGGLDNDMTTVFDWHGSYKAAVLETDWTRILQRIDEAESTMAKRKRRLSLDHGGTPEERHALAAALSGLKALREEVAAWQLRNPAC